MEASDVVTEVAPSVFAPMSAPIAIDAAPVAPAMEASQGADVVGT